MHPLWFGIYEDLIYHHGEGFSKRHFERIDEINMLKRAGIISIFWYKILWKMFLKLPRGPTRKAVLNRLLEFQEKWLNKDNMILIAEKVFKSIENNPFFYRDFL